MSDKLFKIESMNATGPVVEEMTMDKALYKLNLEKKNKRMVFIDGKPVMSDIISEADLIKCKKSITIVNELVGG